MKKEDLEYMQRCLQLAKNGLGNTKTNPMVGAVVVHEGKIIGEGFHAKYGEAHAEVNAINAVKDKSLLAASTIYVSLEPCSHFGKTPPCSDLIIKSGIKKVVIACQDTFSEVSGKGIEKLKNAGCEVVVGVLEKEARQLNKRFFTFNEQKRPYITLKWAQSADGLMDIERAENTTKKSFQISNKASRYFVHQLRASEMGIMVGTNTVLNDNPSLNLRYFAGNHPTKIVIDRNLKIPKDYKIFNPEAVLIIFHDENLEQVNSSENVKYIGINFSKNIISQVMIKLYEENINSILVEGGAALLNSFLQDNIWDEAFVIQSEIKLVKGLKAPIIEGENCENYQLEDNVISHYKSSKNKFYKQEIL